MLKRHQVLLTDWLGDHLKMISEKYDISFSEAIRLTLCLQITKLVSTAYPKYKVATFDKELVGVIQKAKVNKTNMENLHKLLSKIYFEARKAMEFWAAEEKKRKSI